MKIQTSDPDLESLVRRMRRGVLDLQPDFQRGEVWGHQKKLRLIDSLLRNWHIPPIHLVVDAETQTQEVLDGQQRLSAIRDFYDDKLPVSGDILPESAEIRSIAGKTYSQLPAAAKQKFDLYTIRVVSISEHTAEEAGELFYRLNQPTNLTAAEQRNAFFGPARTQVKGLVHKLESWNLTRKTLGFDNSRMAYDDVIARACYYINQGTLRQKVTGSSITAVYRSSTPFEEQTIKRITESLKLLGRIMRPDESLKLNKATMLTWLVWLCDVTYCLKPNTQALSDFIHRFEAERARMKISNISEQRFSIALLELFSDRASSRVADVSSVLTRHAVLWVEYLRFAEISHSELRDPGLSDLAEQGPKIFRRRTAAGVEEELNKITDREDWGLL